MSEKGAMLWASFFFGGRRSIASLISFSLRLKKWALVFSGMSGKQTNPAMATGRVMMPSYSYQYLLKVILQEILTDHEDPFPARKTSVAIHRLVDSCHHGTSEHTSCLTNSSENGGSFGNLLGLAVPTQF